MKKGIPLSEHTSIYRINISSDLSEYQHISYRLKTIIAEYSSASDPCEVDIPMCWSNILLRHVKQMISIDEAILFQRMVSEYGGLRMKAQVTVDKFPKIRELVKEATLEIDALVQDRLKIKFA